MTGFCFQQCCGDDYTTRAYDLSLNTLWSANYFDGIPYTTVVFDDLHVNCQLIDSTQVYVGGERVTDGVDFWSLVAFDLVTGELLWKRDLYDDILGSTADIVDTFDSGSGTYRPLYNGTLQIELWGQGGSPPAAGASQVDGAQAGGYCKKTLTVTANQAITYAIGLNSHDSNGGNTTATSSPNTYTANGGSKTTSGAGTATNGDVNTTGGSGTAGALDEGGAGGNSPNGGTGGSGGNSGAPGVDGNAPGGGGGGAGTGGGDSGIGGHGRVKFTLTPTDPIGYLGDVIQIQQKSDGNIVAMLDPSNSNTVKRVQYFVEVQPDGTLVDVYSFVQKADTVLTTQYLPTRGFTIDEDDTFHILSRMVNSSINQLFECLAMYELPDPWTTATVYEDRSGWVSATHRSFSPEQIVRIGGRDYVAGTSYNGATTGSSYCYDCPGLLKGASQTQSIRLWSQIAKTIYPFPSLSANTVFAAGTNQATATLLTAGESTGVTAASTGQGVILPSGASVGDVCSVRLSSGNPLRIYPPSGGVIIESDQFDRTNLVSTLHVENAVNTHVLLSSSLDGLDDYYFCMGSNVWLRFAIRYQTTSIYNQLVRWLPSLDSSDNIITVNHDGELVKHDANGVPIWWAGETHIHSVCDDSDNIYAIGVRDSGGASVVKRDSDGLWVAGHRHHGDRETDLLDAQKYPSLIHFDPTGDSAAGAIIASGQIAQTSSDVDFVSDPW